MGGNFTTVNGVEKSGVVGLNATTGTLTSFNHSFTVVANSFLIMKDLKIYNNNIYAAGNFTSVDGLTIQSIASFNLSTGTLRNWNINNNIINPNLKGIATIGFSNSNVYLGGSFSTINSMSRINFATVDETTASLQPLTASNTTNTNNNAANSATVESFSDVINNEIILTGTFTSYWQKISTVIKSNQTITFPTILNKTIGALDFSPNAISSSGLAITYTSSNTNVATIINNQIHIVGAGSATITASQAGDNSYNAATSVSQTLTVTAAPKINQTITFSNINKTYNDAPFALNATTNASGSITYTSANSSVVSISGNTATVVGAGSTTITASNAGDATYNSGSVTATVTVAKANQTITFNALSNQTVGALDFSPNAIASSGLAVTYTSSNTNVATIVNNQIHIVGAGSATITASQAGDTNYSAISGSQTLVVNALKMDQTISFAAIPAHAYTDATFTLNATATSGLPVTYTVSDNTIATLNGNVVTIVNVGTVTITASQAGDNNYNAAASVDQALVVNKGNQTITFSPVADVTLGDPSFSLTASTSSRLPITFLTTPNRITLIGNVVTAVSAGRDTLVATQSGNGNFNAAIPVSRIFCINPAQPSITISGTNTVSPTLTSSSAKGNQWFLNGVAIANATANTLSVTAVGSYTVQVSADDCKSAMSAAQVFIITGDVQTLNQTVSVYPNPANNRLAIGLEQLAAGTAAIKVYDLMGRGIDILSGEGGSLVTLDLTNYGAGTYVLEIVHNNQLYHERFIKH